MTCPGPDWATYNSLPRSTAQLSPPETASAPSKRFVSSSLLLIAPIAARVAAVTEPGVPKYTLATRSSKSACEAESR